MAKAPSAGGGVPQFASLYVGDLKPEVTEAMLYEIFNAVGPVASIRVCRDSITRKSLGYGYVNFHSVSDAERALDTLNYSSIKGRSCRIMWSQRDPSLRKAGTGNIYVKNLDTNIDNKALYDTFSLFGNILSCKVATDPEGASYGYGFVQYENEDAATQAIQRVNGMQIGEQTVQVCEFVKHNTTKDGKPDMENYTNLYVKCFPADWDEAKLNELFGEIGTVSASALRKDNKGRVFAFINYEKTEDAKKAVETLHKKDLRSEEEIAKAKDEGKEQELDAEGHPVHSLYVGRAQTKAERAADLRSKFSTDAVKGEGVNLYVKNLDENCDDAALRELFDAFGTITSVSVAKDERGNGKCKGYGFVCFTSPVEATKAVTEMHLKAINGKPLYVGLAEKREARQERLKTRYTPNKGGDKGSKGKGKGFQNSPMPQGGMMSGLGGGPPMGMMGPMGGMGMMGPRPGPGGGMMMPQGAMRPMMGPGGPMMGGPQMMAMMGKGMPPQMMGKGGMPGMMPMPRGPMPGSPMNQGGGRPPMPVMMQQTGPPQAGTPLNASVLAAAPPAVQKQMIGEKLFPAISKIQPELAGKITGMMLEMDNRELLMLLESEHQLKAKVDEAIRVLG
jgi:polyadenylate-binding protein